MVSAVGTGGSYCIHVFVFVFGIWYLAFGIFGFWHLAPASAHSNSQSVNSCLPQLYNVLPNPLSPVFCAHWVARKNIFLATHGQNDNKESGWRSCHGTDSGHNCAVAVSMTMAWRTYMGLLLGNLLLLSDFNSNAHVLAVSGSASRGLQFNKSGGKTPFILFSRETELNQLVSLSRYVLVPNSTGCGLQSFA